MKRDLRARSLAKGLSWRALGTFDTTLISYFITGSPVKALSIGGIEVFTKVFLFYFHERLWQRVRWGMHDAGSGIGLENAPENIHPNTGQLLQRQVREAYLHQRSKVIWLTGLSGSGKTTIAQELERRLLQENFFAQVLDGDNIRSSINSNLGFSLDDRKENIRRIAEVAKLYLNSGVITICTFISPTKEIRAFAKDIIGADDFIEIYVNAPLEVCEKRDVKGLYSKARKGEIKEFTGISSPFEAPENPALEIRTDQENIDEAVKKILGFLEPIIKH
ncbi:MAG: adenylyl-sulfate kinase [Saprospiraceae bacterium]|nr:MAG: adenylyl-sulfate kinase [Saprospiraceae bacterium]